MAGFAGGAFTAKVPTAAAAPLSGVDDLMRVGAGGTARAGSTAGGALAADMRAISSAEAWQSYGGFPAWSGEFSAVEGAAAQRAASLVYPEGFALRIDQSYHLAKFDGFTQRAGISGAHNSNEFYKAANDYGVKILSETPTDVPGITHITYQIPAKDKLGNAVPGVMKNDVFPKTIYDPNVFSDQKILELGQEAARSGYSSAVKAGLKEYPGSAGGINFRVYLGKDGFITNIHPVR